MIKAIIIDDEKNAVAALEAAIKEFCPQVEITGIAYTANEGIKEIQQKNPDLVFVDIEMPGMTGLELIEQFTGRTFDVIFVTAYNQYAVKAFKVSATDYLLKPINVMELINAVKKLADRRETNREAVPELKTDKLKVALSGKLSVPTTNGAEYINIKEIVRIEADGSYVKIFTTDKKVRLVSRNLKSLEDSLEGEGFFRTHKSYLINLEHLKKFCPTKDGGYVEMADGSEILVARSVKSILSDIINRFAR